MKKCSTLIAFLFVGFALFAQDPVNPNDDSGEVETICEPFLAASYDQDAQTLTIRYEDCQQDGIFWGWCGTFCGFGETIDGAEKGYTERELMVGNFNGRVHYAETFSNYDEIPEDLVINNLALSTGIYFVRLKTFQNNESKIFHVKFAVN
jgi:hypothetical protein